MLRDQRKVNMTQSICNMVDDLGLSSDYAIKSKYYIKRLIHCDSDKVEQLVCSCKTTIAHFIAYETII